MFNVGPLEIVVLAIVAIVVVGPDKLPKLARDAAEMLRTLRELATGARQQLRDELGPDFADVDLRNLNPRTAVQRAVFGDDVDLGRLNPRNALRDAIFGDEDPRQSWRDELRDIDPRQAWRDGGRDADPRAAVHGIEADEAAVRMTKTATPAVKPVSQPPPIERPRPRPRPSGSGHGDGLDDVT